MDKFYFENTQGTHNKFWAISLSNQPNGQWLLTRRWGQIGQEGRTMIEPYGHFIDAGDKKDELIREKIAKGYIPVL